MGWLIGLGLGALGLVGLWADYTAFYEGRLEQPAYTVVSQENGVEIRTYAPFVIALTQATQPGDAGLRDGFRTLARYLFGGNKPRESLAMTAPVLQTSGESLPMTAPVIQSPGPMQVAFVMPADRSIESLPMPLGDSVTLVTEDWGEVAAIRFSGYGRQARFQAAEAELRAYLSSQGHTASGPARYAQYNSPSAFPPLRRNEVLIPITR